MNSVYKQGNTYVLRVGVGRSRQVPGLGDLTRDGASGHRRRDILLILAVKQKSAEQAKKSEMRAADD